MHMIVNTRKIKLIIINNQNISYANFMYDNNIWEDVNSYKFMSFDIHQKINLIYIIDKWSIGGSNASYGFENNCKIRPLVLG